MAIQRSSIRGAGGKFISKQWNDQEITILQELSINGSTQAEIAKQMNITVETVRTILRTHKKWTLQEIAQLKELHLSGHTQMEIAKLMGLTRDVVRSQLRHVKKEIKIDCATNNEVISVSWGVCTRPGHMYVWQWKETKRLDWVSAIVTNFFKFR